MGSRRSKGTCERIAARLTADAATATQMLADAEREASPPTRVTGACSTTIRTSGSRPTAGTTGDPSCPPSAKPRTPLSVEGESTQTISPPDALASTPTSCSNEERRELRGGIGNAPDLDATRLVLHSVFLTVTCIVDDARHVDQLRLWRHLSDRYPCLVGAGLRGTEVGSAAHAPKRPENPSRSREQSARSGLATEGQPRF